MNVVRPYDVNGGQTRRFAPPMAGILASLGGKSEIKKQIFRLRHIGIADWNFIGLRSI